ncbi:MAG: hypothetical protein ACLT29_00600 [Ruminococcus callidus]
MPATFMVADAALPAYDILLYCLKTTDSALLTEDLLDILVVLLLASKIQLVQHGRFLSKKLMQDKSIFASYFSMEEEKKPYAAFAKRSAHYCKLLRL